VTCVNCAGLGGPPEVGRRAPRGAGKWRMGQAGSPQSVIIIDCQRLIGLLVPLEPRVVSDYIRLLPEMQE